jgi:deoxyuridine 5'-triphosphate nucleotidohydrolase
MIFPKLLSTSSTGALRYWIIKVIKNKNDNTALIVREYGQVNGKPQFSQTLITEGKSKDTPYEQAVFNANSLWKDQIQKKGYYEDKDNEINISFKKKFKSEYEEEPAKIEDTFSMLPMLAKQYLEQKNHVVFPCYVQPKLDGIRYTARRVKSDIEFRTRNNKIKPFFDHIRNDIHKLNLPDDVILDGEFYSFNPNVPFKNLNGYCNMVKFSNYLSIPDEYEIQVRPKSGLAINQGLTVLNTPGTVDSGYNGEIKVIVFNTNNLPVTISKGTKIAQAVLCPVVNGTYVNLQLIDKIEDKDRGNNGFGSTGII